MTTDGTQTSSSLTPLCVLFADVSGSTHLYESLGDKQAMRIIGECIKRMDSATKLHGGTTVQIVGDEIMATFPNPELGMEAAADMMRRIVEQREVVGLRLALRIGLHHGPVLLQNNYVFIDQPDIFGDTVNTAARITALAKSNQILASAETVELMPPRWRQASRSLDAFSLKGKSEEMRICELLWEDKEDATIIRMPVATLQVRLVLSYLDRRWVLDETQRGVSLGREADNDFAIDDRRISRQHATIERRQNKFVLIDKSTNGSFVTIEGYGEIPVRREEFILHGRGHISLGHAYDNADLAGTLAFEVAGFSPI
ncbi:Adenylate cyclase, class 3 [Methylomagnum ishizawai]|uniref:Adenylate cyclase, class 3 n=1 Tax=Methylomagnum ishizawai TaxID=1760988 RepID=A0A1Y6CWI6_9GAMM|nr:adenylate/guanylate cyclase domain-containing protein [Methylomagnum ishizawai]SMF95028.1 Adenylate cyclase, class 3 [Methylomagnum ishizawai]